MSLAELLPLVNNLNQSDKLSRFKFLSAQIPDAELQVIFSALEYPVWSPYDATEASNILMQMIQDDPEASTHANLRTSQTLLSYHHQESRPE